MPHTWMTYVDRTYVIQGMKSPCVPVSGVPEMRCTKMVSYKKPPSAKPVSPQSPVRKRCSLTIYTISLKYHISSPALAAFSYLPLIAIWEYSDYVPGS